jgi:hypothetical protein
MNDLDSSFNLLLFANGAKNDESAAEGDHRL